MSKFTNFLEKTVENIVGKEEEKRLDSLFSFGETVLNKFGAKYGRLWVNLIFSNKIRGGKDGVF